MPNDTPGLDIFHDGHRIRLKWHRLRLALDAPLFSAATMAEGFRVGASMELDLRVRGDGGFVVLHDSDLEGETTGYGPVCKADAATIRALSMKSGGTLPILSEDLAGLMQTAHPEALLQFDMKDDLKTIGEKGLNHLARTFAGLGRFMIVSGADLDLIEAIKTRLPDAQRGIDPTNKLLALLRQKGPSAVEAELRADCLGPTEPKMIYLSWPLILEAHAAGLDLIGLCHALGKTVDAWTFNIADRAEGFSDDEWQRFSILVSLKPDQITTDEAPATEHAWLARCRT